MLTMTMPGCMVGRNEVALVTLERDQLVSGATAAPGPASRSWRVGGLSSRVRRARVNTGSS